MTMFTFFGKANLTKRDEQALRQLIGSPEAEQIRERAERAIIEKRIALKAKLDTIDQRHDDDITAAGLAYQAAMRALEAAEAKLIAAREEEHRARTTSYALESVKLREAHELRQELIACCDVRLDEFHEHLSDAGDKLRHLTQITAFPHRSWTGEKSIRYVTNADEVAALSTAIKEAMADVSNMKLLPLTRGEVSERLTALTHKLEPALDKFSLPTPRLDVDGEVTLSRERLKLADVLQDNGLSEPGDAPASTTAQSRPRTLKQGAGSQKPTAAAERPGTKNTR